MGVGREGGGREREREREREKGWRGVNEFTVERLAAI